MRCLPGNSSRSCDNIECCPPLKQVTTASKLYGHLLLPHHVLHHHLTLNLQIHINTLLNEQTKYMLHLSNCSNVKNSSNKWTAYLQEGMCVCVWLNNQMVSHGTTAMHLFISYLCLSCHMSTAVTAVMSSMKSDIITTQATIMVITYLYTCSKYTGRWIFCALLHFKDIINYQQNGSAENCGGYW